MQVIVQNLLINYEIRGSGKTVLMLHGWADKLETFKPLYSKLESTYQLVSLDLPGFGKSQPPQESWDLSDYAQFLQQFLKKIEHSPYAVIGHSNGGALAVHAVALGNVQADKLVLLAASGVRDIQNFRRMGVKAVAKIGKIMTFWMPPGTRRRLQKVLYGTVGSDMFVAEHLSETFKRTVRQDIQADAARLALPTLMIYGSQDKATPISAVADNLHHLIKNSRLEIIHGADHFVHQEQSHRVGSLIRDFLES